MMEIALCYIAIYLAEAFIIKQYCSTLFVSKYPDRIEFLIIFIFYGILLLFLLLILFFFCFCMI